MIDIEKPVAAARAANHCAQLLSRSADPVDSEQEAARLSDRFAEHVQPLLAQHCDTSGLKVAAGSVEALTFEAACERIGAHAVNSFFTIGTERTGILVSVATCELMAMFERLLGGEGTIDRANTRLPRSAMQFATRFEQRLLTAIRTASDRDEFAVGASRGSAREAAPFAAQETVWFMEFAVSQPGSGGCTLQLVLCPATLALITNSRAASPATGRAIGTRGLDNSAIGHVEFPVRAVLVDTELSLSRLMRLEPGALIPVALNRSVPLLIEQAVIAHGTVGEVDDRVALEVSHTSLPGTR